MFYNYDSRVFQKIQYYYLVNILIFVILPLFYNSLISVAGYVIEFKTPKYQVTITVKDNNEEPMDFKAGRR